MIDQFTPASKAWTTPTVRCISEPTTERPRARTDVRRDPRGVEDRDCVRRMQQREEQSPAHLRHFRLSAGHPDIESQAYFPLPAVSVFLFNVHTENRSRKLPRLREEDEVVRGVHDR